MHTGTAPPGRRAVVSSPSAHSSIAISAPLDIAPHPASRHLGWLTLDLRRSDRGSSCCSALEERAHLLLNNPLTNGQRVAPTVCGTRQPPLAPFSDRFSAGSAYSTDNTHIRPRRSRFTVPAERRVSRIDANPSRRKPFAHAAIAWFHA
jgi:hypothetical protein